MAFGISSEKKKIKAFKKMKSALAHIAPFCSADLRCNTQKGLISVVLPVYNYEKYLEESIISVLSQTYTNLELIIVDDGSEDSSGQIADSFLSKDDRVSVIHQKNMTLPIALNNGFSVAKGEFLTWTSADNRMMPSCLEILSSELIRNRYADMVFGNMILIDEKGDVLRGYGWYEFPPLSGRVILPDSTDRLNVCANNTIGAAFLYRAGAAAVLKGYSEYKYMLEDYDYFMRMNSLLNINHIMYKKPVYEYRFHSESLTSRDEELGITSSRPALMELDSFRRDFYQKPLNFYIDGNDKELYSLLSNMGKIITSPQKAEKYEKSSPIGVIYVNLGNCAPTWTPPRGIPKFLVCRDAAETFGYDVMICKNAATLCDGWISASTPQTAASFIFLRAKNDILYNYEGNKKTLIEG